MHPQPWDQTWWGLTLLAACSLLGVGLYATMFLVFLVWLLH